MEGTNCIADFDQKLGKWGDNVLNIIVDLEIEKIPFHGLHLSGNENTGL